MRRRTSVVLLLILTSALAGAARAQDASSQGQDGEFRLLPIRTVDAVLGVPFAHYERGELEVDAAKLALAVRFTARPDGSLEGVRVVRSSGVREIDAAALGLLKAVDDGRAAGPLAVFEAVEVSTTPEGDSVRFEVAGESASPEAAKEEAEKVGSQVSMLKLFGSRLTHASRRALELMRVSTDGARVVGTVVISRAEVYALMRERYSAF